MLFAETLSLPCAASMLDAPSAWRLSRTCRRVVVCWDEVRLRVRCRMPRALGMTLSAKTRWCVKDAMAVLGAAPQTPFRTRANLLRHLFRHVLTPQQLYEVGYKLNHIATMRLAMRLHRKNRVRTTKPI